MGGFFAKVGAEQLTVLCLTDSCGVSSCASSMLSPIRRAAQSKPDDWPPCGHGDRHLPNPQ